MNESPDDAPEKVGISGAASVFVAWFCANVNNQASLARSLSDATLLDTRVLVHVYDAGHLFALGLVAAGLSGAFRRWGKNRKSLAFLGLFLISLAVSAVVIPADASNMSVRLAGAYGSWATTGLLVGSVLVFGLSLPIAWLFGRLLARPYLRWLGVIGGTVAFSTHALLLQNGYHGVHLFIVLAATTLFGASLAGACLPEFFAKRFSRQAPRFLRSAGLALAAAWAAFSIGRRPPANVAAELVRYDATLLPHFLLRLVHAPTPLRTEPIPAEMQEWFVDRTKHPPVPPSSPAIIPDKPIVIFITIDCTRADVVMSRKYDTKLHNFAHLRDISTAFSNVRSTAPGTISSLASIFMSTHFSQQYWVPVGTKGNPFPDDSVRLQEVLGRDKITTVTFTGAPGLTPKFGLLRGFTESTDLQTSRLYTPADTLMNVALRRLLQAEGERVFLYLHFLEAHEPYDLALQTGSQFDRYLSELQLVDKQLDRLMRFIATHELRDRTLLIVSADHGEAFGEHGTVHHSSTIYDELLRVPLLIWRPGQKPAVVNEPISLIDLAPTILDVFGVPTPGHFMGQSLVPFLRGENPKLTRPILAEARLKQALVLPDGLKVIVDNRLNTVELYDVRADPQEMTSLADDEERLSRPLSLLRQFFEVHHNRTPGYTPPYRVW